MFLDCAPSLGHLTQLGLAAADTVVLVLRPEYDHLQGAIRVRDFIAGYRRHLGRPDLRSPASSSTSTTAAAGCTTGTPTRSPTRSGPCCGPHRSLPSRAGRSHRRRRPAARPRRRRSPSDHVFTALADHLEAQTHAAA